MSELFDDKVDEDLNIVDELHNKKDETVSDARRRLEKLIDDKRLREDLDDFFE